MPKTTKHGIYGIYLLGMMLKVLEESNSNMAKSRLLDQCKTMFIVSEPHFPSHDMDYHSLGLTSQLAKVIMLESSRCH